MNVPTVILPNPKSAVLAKSVLDEMYNQSIAVGNPTTMPTIISMEMEKFSDGEFAPIITQTVRDRRVFILQQVQTSQELVELCMTIDAVKRCSGEKAVVILPYMPFSRQDKTMDKRTSLGAKVVASMIQASGADAVICLDLHAPQIAGFFTGIPVDMINGNIIFKKYIEELGLDMENVCWLTPDIGGSKRAMKFKQMFPTSSFAVIDKTRPRANEIGTMTLIGDVTGMDCILVDDMGDTLGTITKASNLVMEKGAKSVRAILTHPILSGNAYQLLDKSPLVELIVSDSITLKQAHPRIKVVSIATSLATAMLRLTTSQSVSEINH